MLPTGWWAPLAGYGHFRVWRLFVAAATLASLSSALSMWLLPESPQFLLEVNVKAKDDWRNIEQA